MGDIVFTEITFSEEEILRMIVDLKMARAPIAQAITELDYIIQKLSDLVCQRE